MGAKTDKGKVSEKPFKVLIKRKPKTPKVQRGRGFWFGHPLPTVVGLPVAEAKRRIKQCRPDVYIEVHSVNALLTMAYHSNRVRLLVDRFSKVVTNPHIG